MSKTKPTPPQLNEAAYAEIVNQAISQIRTARMLIARQVNSSTQSVYWNLGKLLSEKQLEEGYGSGVINQLSIDLKNEFPDMGLSPRNLWDMKRFYERYHQADTKLRQAVAVSQCWTLKKKMRMGIFSGLANCFISQSMKCSIVLT
ncbi:hypothetical protein GCM10023189_36290 [Nibrella saemangeumensis]|uniref:YhcG N-terminal domain-containing protein n=1 Tax=Nibrella saemangeumensis TaxID=1084526 RepID=A0ABP8N442_9BACT